MHCCCHLACNLSVSACAHPIVMQAFPPSLTYARDQVVKALIALRRAYGERVQQASAHARADELEVFLGRGKVSIEELIELRAHRTQWPAKALEFMQKVDELHAKLLKQDQQRKAKIQAAESEFLDKMHQYWHEVCSLSYEP